MPSISNTSTTVLYNPRFSQIRNAVVVRRLLLAVTLAFRRQTHLAKENQPVLAETLTSHAAEIMYRCARVQYAAEPRQLGISCSSGNGEIVFAPVDDYALTRGPLAGEEPFVEWQWLNCSMCHKASEVGMFGIQDEVPLEWDDEAGNAESQDSIRPEASVANRFGVLFDVL